MDEQLNVLTLDGGGSLGVYTIGVLEALREDLDTELHHVFNLIYGTSTGSIIASMIALETPISEIKDEYFKLAPYIMSPFRAKTKSKRLREKAYSLFKTKKFDEFKDIAVGIVAVDKKTKKQRIFKSNIGQDFGTTAKKFNPGFGATIADAVVGSCAAYPVFEEHVATLEGGACTLLDGGYIANDPSLFALTDAVHSLNYSLDSITMLSVGVGSWTPSRLNKAKRLIDPLELMELVFETSRNGYTNTLIPLLFKDCERYRIDSDYTEDDNIRTSFVESNEKTLMRIYELGRTSYEQYVDREKVAAKLMSKLDHQNA